jgi:hypothetical protein
LVIKVCLSPRKGLNSLFCWRPIPLHLSPFSRQNSSYSGVMNSTLHHLGYGGVVLVGGDRARLQRSHLYAVNNTSYSVSRILRTYHPAIHIHGCGIQACSASHYDWALMNGTGLHLCISVKVGNSFKVAMCPSLPLPYPGIDDLLGGSGQPPLMCTTTWIKMGKILCWQGQPVDTGGLGPAPKAGPRGGVWPTHPSMTEGQLGALGAAEHHLQHPTCGP